MPRSQRPTGAPSTSAAAEESSPLSGHQEVVPDWLVGNRTENDANNNKQKKKSSRARSRSLISRAHSGTDTLNASTVETDCDGERSGCSQRGRGQTRNIPGKNQRRRRSLSLGRRRSRSRSRSRSYSTNDRLSDEYGHYAPTPTNNTNNDDDEDDDGFDDEDPNGMQVMNELGFPTNIPPNDDFLVEDDYDPSKHGPGDDFSFSCGTCQSDFEPPIFLQFMQYMMEETKELCTTICGGNGDSVDDEESKTLATNEFLLKEEMSRPGAHMRRNQSRTLVGSDPAAQAGQFNPYGDDDTKEKVARKDLRGMRRSRSRTRSLPSRRSKSMERKLAKWKSAKSKMKNKGMEYASAEAASADPTDWRTVCDDVLSTREEGHFVAYEAGRVRSSTKRSNSRTRQDGMERFLYM